MSGKGSAPRPFEVDQDTFASNWDRVFGKQPAQHRPQRTCRCDDCVRFFIDNDMEGPSDDD